MGEDITRLKKNIEAIKKVMKGGDSNDKKQPAGRSTNNEGGQK